MNDAEISDRFFWVWLVIGVLILGGTLSGEVMLSLAKKVQSLEAQIAETGGGNHE